MKGVIEVVQPAKTEDLEIWKVPWMMANVGKESIKSGKKKHVRELDSEMIMNRFLY